jgi:hypothetical protein
MIRRSGTMAKRCLALLLVATLLLAAAPVAFARGGPPWANFKDAKDLKFKDWAEAGWALEHMVMMRARGIIKGYADGKFKPNAAISQAEAVVMVIRMKGEAAEQAALAMNTTPAVPGIAAAFWARGYINYALQQGWIDSTFQPNAAAKRAWVARLMVKALVDGWQAQVAANANAVLPFKDADQIKPEDRPFIAIVVAKGWMHGYPNGQFQPNKPITRAEMAALLNRGTALLPGRHPYEVEGRVESVDATNRKIRVRVQQQSLEFTVSADALIFLERQVVGLADLKVGDKVEMMLNASQIVLVIKAERDERQGWYPFQTWTVTATNFTGSPKTITVQPSVGIVPLQTTTYVLEDDCEVEWLGNEVPLSTVAVGDKVRLDLDDGKVEEIKIIEKAGSTSIGSEITGTIAEVVVASSGVSIRITGYPLYPIAAGATITPVMAPSALQTGWVVKATLSSGYIVAVQVLNQGSTITASGTLESLTVSASGYRLGVRDAASVLHDYYLASGAVVKSGTVSLAATDLQTGMLVQITVVSSQITVVDITATTVSGVVNTTSFSTSPKTITVTPTAGTATVYTLATICKVFVGTTEVTLANVNSNDVVQMLVYSGINKVGRITITTDVLQGTVTAIMIDGTGTKLTLNVAGTTHNYYLASGVTLPAGIVPGTTVVQVTVVSNLITAITIVP